MTVAPGTRLGHYTILAPLGAGGMGEVWLAEDATLKRKVALKVLPAAVAADPDRLARFQREAEAIAALSHPNIVTIHSIEQESRAPGERCYSTGFNRWDLPREILKAIESEASTWSGR